MAPKSRHGNKLLQTNIQVQKLIKLFTYYLCKGKKDEEHHDDYSSFYDCFSDELDD